MQTDFSKIDKSDFKCLKTADGAIYYGQIVQILPPDVETDKLAGFRVREEEKKPNTADQVEDDDARNMTAGSGGFRVASSRDSRKANIPADPLSVLHNESVEPLVVEDLSQVDEELQPKLVTVRHGLGIQIQADKVSKYAGQWRYGARHGDGHLVNADGSEYRGNFFFGSFNGYGCFEWPKCASDAVSEN